MIQLLIPGRAPLLVTEVTAEVLNPADISNFAIALIEPIQDPLQGLVIYSSHKPPFDSWQFLGALSNVRPSEIINVNWAFDPEMSALPVIYLRVALEPAALIISKIETTPLLDIRKELARKTALNLFNYLSSFDVGGAAPVLKEALESWFVRFEQKYARDPNFILRTTDLS